MNFILTMSKVDFMKGLAGFTSLSYYSDYIRKHEWDLRKIFLNMYIIQNLKGKYISITQFVLSIVLHDELTFRGATK